MGTGMQLIEKRPTIAGMTKLATLWAFSWFSIACGAPSQPAKVAEPPAVRQAQETPKSDGKGKAHEGQSSISGGHTESTKSTERTGESRGQTRETPVAKLELPAWSRFTAAAKHGEWKAPAKASSRVWLDDVRAVAVVRTQKGSGDSASFRVSLVRLKQESEVWAPAGIREIETWNAHDELGRDGTIAVNLRVQDVDDDGENEVLARFRLDWMCCGAGATARRTLVVLNDDAELSEAAYIHLDESIYRGATTGKERFEDRNNDGHRDLVVKWKAVYEGEPDDSGENVHTWMAKQDWFKSARRPSGEGCMCE